MGKEACRKQGLKDREEPAHVHPANSDKESGFHCEYDEKILKGFKQKNHIIWFVTWQLNYRRTQLGAGRPFRGIL